MSSVDIVYRFLLYFLLCSISESEYNYYYYWNLSIESELEDPSSILGRDLSKLIVFFYYNIIEPLLLLLLLLSVLCYYSSGFLLILLLSLLLSIGKFIISIIGVENIFSAGLFFSLSLH